jgi:hypothetical protein
VGDALVPLLIFLVAPVAILACGAFFFTHSLRQANKVAPRRGGPVPLPWLWSPGLAAALHRRLRYACQVAGTVAVPAPGPRRLRRRLSAQPFGDGIAELAREVVREAVFLDGQLVTASRLGRGYPRAQALGSLEYQVAVVEDAAARVHRLATRRAQLSRPVGPAQLSLGERISAMEAALGELSQPPSP